MVWQLLMKLKHFPKILETLNTHTSFVKSFSCSKSRKDRHLFWGGKQSTVCAIV